MRIKLAAQAKARAKAGAAKLKAKNAEMRNNMNKVSAMTDDNIMDEEVRSEA